MRWARRTLAGGWAALALCACSNGGQSQDGAQIPWRDYPPSLQKKIDAMAAAKDCKGLLLEFNEIGGTNLAVRTKFGHGNTELLQYINTREERDHCFDAVRSTS